MLPLNLFFNQALAQERQLEIAYPEIFGVAPRTIDFGIAQYLAYIFNFVIIIVGLVAFAALIYGGIRYLTSAGKPNELKKAQEQVKSAVFGIILLLFSYLILTTINPKLVVFDLPLLKPAPSIEVTQPTVPPPLSADPLVRVRSLAEAAKSTASLIDNTASTIKTLTDSCSCSTTQPLCLTTGAGGFSATLAYLAGFEGTGLTPYDIRLFAAPDNVLLQKADYQLLGGAKIYVNREGFSNADLNNLASFVAQAKGFFGKDFQNVLNNTPVYVLNNQNYRNLASNYVEQFVAQGLLPVTQKDRLISSLVGTRALILNKEVPPTIILDGNAILQENPAARLMYELVNAIDVSFNLSSGAEYRDIYNQAREFTAYINDYARYGGPSVDLAETVVAYYTYGIPDWISGNRNAQISIKERFDYLRLMELVRKLDADLEYLYRYAASGVQPDYIHLSNPLDQKWLTTSSQLAPQTAPSIYVMGEFRDSERRALERGANSAIESFNPKYHSLLRRVPTYIADENEYGKIAEEYGRKYGQSLTPEQRENLVNRYKETGGLNDPSGIIFLNGPATLSSERIAFGAGAVTTPLHEYAHTVDRQELFSQSVEWIDMFNRSLDLYEKQGYGGFVNVAASQNPKEDFAWTIQAYYSSFGVPGYVPTYPLGLGLEHDPETQKLIKEHFDFIRENGIVKTPESPF